jgi:hypothetical protein
VVTGNGINYHNGPVLHAVKVYYIWYGDWNGLDPTGPPILTDFVSNEGGSSYFNINTTYGDTTGAVPNAVFRYAEHRAAQVTTHFVTVADAMKNQYLAAGIGRPEQYTRIFSGFVLEPFLAANKGSLAADLLSESVSAAWDFDFAWP